MSGSTVGGVVGGVIGFVASGYNPAGFQYGWMIGSAVGGYVDPDIIKGPRLTDAQTQTSNEGVPRPIVYGTTALSGNIIQVGPLVEHKHKERTGKGGPVQVTYTYTRTVAIRICEAAPLGGTMVLRRVWQDDKLVYDASGSGTDAASQKFASQLTFYSGAETQLPDPTLEALPAANGGGVGNVPAYRGSCYAVLANLDVTDRQGAVPQFRWEVSSCGSSTTTPSNTVADKAVLWLEFGDGSLSGFPDQASPSEPASVFSSWPDPTPYVVFDEPLFGRSVGSVRFEQGSGFDVTEARSGNVAMNSAMTGPCFYWTWFKAPSVSSFSRHGLMIRAGNLSANYTNVYLDHATGRLDFGINTVVLGASNTTFSSNRTGLCDDRKHHLLMAYDGATYKIYIDGVLDKTVSHPYPPGGGAGQFSLFGAIQGDDGMDIALAQTVWGIGTIDADEVAAVYNNGQGITYDGPYPGFQLPDSPLYYIDNEGILHGPPRVQVSACQAPLDETVADICSRAGVSAAEVDVSALSADDLRGFAISRQMGANDAIRALQQVKYFDFPEWGNSSDVGTKLRAVKRGGASVLTLTDDDLIDWDEDEETRAQQVEFPRKMTIRAADPDSNYEPIAQSSERVSENVHAVGEATVDTGVVMTRDEAAQTADIMLRLAWEAATGTKKLAVPEEFSRYTPSDVITFSSKRWHLDRVNLLDGYSEWEMTRDRASAYSSSAAGSGAITPSTPATTVRGPTMFSAMNLPSLKAQDNTPGMYIAVCGLSSGWQGCDLYLSVDAGVSEQKVATILQPATMGVLTNYIAASGEPIPVELYSGELESVTTAQLEARLNGFAITTGNVSEIAQFQNETPTGTKTYDLTTVSRGQLGTTAAAHNYQDKFVLLDGGVVFIPLDASLAGKTLIFRPVSIGTPAANNPTYSVMFTPSSYTAPDFYETQTGEVLTTEAGEYLQVE